MTQQAHEQGAHALRNYDELHAEVAALIEIDPRELSGESSLLDFGLDSIRLMTLVERFRASGVEVSFVELAEQPTLAHFARLLGLADPPA